MWYGHGWWMGLSWLFIAAVIIWVVWFSIRRDQRSTREGSAEDLLRRRFANGEIDEDEYRQRLAILKERDGCVDYSGEAHAAHATAEMRCVRGT